MTLAVTGCASSGAKPRPFPVPGDPPAAPYGAIDGYAVAGTALSLRGIPYRDGGSDPSGFDCSGLVWYVFAQHGVALPRTVGEQFRSGSRVRPAALQPGDLVFFTTTARRASHVGVAIGGDEFVHAPSGRGEVRVERIGSSYWAPRFVGARRVMR